MVPVELRPFSDLCPDGMPTKKCKVKSKLLGEYLAAREKLQVAQQAHKQILAGGTDENVILRSRQRVEAIKSLAGEAKVKFVCHCHVHQC